jgi:predicted transcriptional regulator
MKEAVQMSDYEIAGTGWIKEYLDQLEELGLIEGDFDPPGYEETNDMFEKLFAV